MTEIPAEAQRLHQGARAAGGRGDYAAALSLLNQAHQAAPSWAYPLYDAAFTYLLQGDTAQAEHLYRLVDEMHPRGFFTAKTSLDILRREREGEVPAGFSKAFALLEWTPPDDKRGILQSLVQQYPDFAPAWAELFLLLPDPQERLQAIENGLAGHPDAETRGKLLINKGLVLRTLVAADSQRAARPLLLRHRRPRLGFVCHDHTLPARTQPNDWAGPTGSRGSNTRQSNPRLRQYPTPS